MNDRIIEIENYWARVVRDTAEFQQIADAENPEFNTVLKCLYNILKDGFINDLTENGAMRWEKILELPVSSTATLEERKVQILTYLSIRRPYTIRVLRAMLSAIMGEGNYTLNINNDTSTLTIALASTVEHMQEKIDELCARVIPQNLVFEIAELPMGYTKVEYLESTGTQYINTGIRLDEGFVLKCEFVPTQILSYGCVFGARLSTKLVHFMRSNTETRYTTAIIRNGSLANIAFPVNLNESYSLELNDMDKKVVVNGKETSGLDFYSMPELDFYLFCENFPQGGNLANGVRAVWFDAIRLMSFEATNAGRHYNFVPALDTTGTPCMYDTVTGTPIYNSGTGDFLYPTDAAPVMTLDLDEKFYAKRTEHGIRRLYHVPEGCTMSKDEYAAKNGFKEILEPPMPQEGYWVPEWRETDTQLICEWVETEPPTEEGIENE